MSICGECGKTAKRLRKDRCDACYMRLYRGGQLPEEARCCACSERRRAVLARVELGGGHVIVCGNCALIVSRARPPLADVAALRARVARDRRLAPQAPLPGGRRRADRLPAPFDPAVD
jgi:hypothetical protein